MTERNPTEAEEAYSGFKSSLIHTLASLNHIVIDEPEGYHDLPEEFRQAHNHMHSQLLSMRQLCDKIEKDNPGSP